MFSIVDTPEALNSACNALSGTPWLALDTEFVRERTYYPMLCLVQVASPEHIFCVDALKLPDLNQLSELVYDTSILKVLHAARQDLEIFYLLRGEVPAPLFDTQIAASLVGLGEQLGYAQLVQIILDVSIDKTHTRADWSRRPLDDAELRYAANDVRYLGEIYQWLWQELSTSGRLQWLHEEMLGLQEPALYSVEPDNAWRRVKGAERLAADEKMRAKALAAWRESEARQRDLPRFWVLRDNVLLEIARRCPLDADALAAVPGIPRGLVKKHANRLLTLLDQKLLTPALDASARDHRSGRHQASLVDAALVVVRRIAKEQQISPSVLASRKQVKELFRDPQSSPLSRGWRKALMGDELSQMVSEMPENDD